MYFAFASIRPSYMRPARTGAPFIVLGAALVAPAFDLVGLHFADLIAIRVHADCGRDGIREHRLRQVFDAEIWNYYERVAGRNTAETILRQISEEVATVEDHPFVGRT
jgi:hypothetical protein